MQSLDASASREKRTERSKTEVPFAFPTYEEVVSVSHLPPDVFSAADYAKYRTDTAKRCELLSRQVNYLHDRLAAMRDVSAAPSSPSSRRDIVQLLELAEHKFQEVRGSFDTLMSQSELFRSRDGALLVESRLEETSDGIRELRDMLADIRIHGAYQSPSMDQASIRAGFQRGTFQDTAGDFGADYARSDLSPRMLESRLHGLVPMPSDARGQTLAYGSGVGALFGSLACAVSDVAGKEPEVKILTGTSLYFEVPLQISLLRKLMPQDNVVLFNEHERSDLVGALDQDPVVVITEHLVNTPDLPVVPIEEILKRRSGHERRYVIIDYSASGPRFDLSEHAKALHGNDVVILVTSLQKMYQSGDDLVPGGMATIIANRNAPETLGDSVLRARMMRGLFGVNIQTSSAAALSLADTSSVKEYAARIAAAVPRLAEVFEKLGASAVQHVFRPPQRPDGTSEGLFFNVEFSSLGAKHLFAERAIELAKGRRINLSEGTSFGFRYTRFDLDRQLEAKSDWKFLRVAPGVEGEYEIAQLREIFAQALSAAAVSG